MSKNQQNASPETVLLRQPLPKYNFQARKLPKEAPATKTPPQSTQSANLSSTPTVQSSTPTTQNTYVSQPYPQTSLPDNSHNGSAAPRISSTMHRPNSESSLHSGADRRSAAIRPFSLSARQTDISGAVRPMAAVVAPNLRPGTASQEKGAVKFDLGASGNAGAPTAEAVLEGKSGALPVTFLQSAPVVYSEANDIPVPDAALLAYAVEGPSTAEKLERAEKEIEMLKAQLEVQLQVNAEIKRLLVASVGDDFERKVENLARWV
ncbi:hypothetical protein V1264_010048 [Littorina saxatilis]|uniref:Uncharacterized protein n=1 Tax=Littorina saxatilis TaxID=31220 RepID=A0AAN9ANF1_9CAEN